MTAPISAAGLLLDIAGALTLASAFMFKRPRHVVRETGSYYGTANPLLIVSLAKQTADAWVGALLLTLGFLGQLVQSAGWRPKISLWITLPVAAVIALLTFCLLFGILRPWNVKRVVALTLGGQRDVNSSWFGVITMSAAARGREIQPGERPSEIGEWLVGRRRWTRLTNGMDLPPNLTQPWQPT